MAVSRDNQSHFIGPLSEDVILKIIGFLELPYRCHLQLNREFRRVVIHAFNCATEIDGRQMRGKAAFLVLLPRCHVVQTLCLSACAWVDDMILHELASNCPLLSRLDLRACTQITDSGIATLAQACRQLRHIDLTFCPSTTYASVLTLRDTCGPDTIVRRQPTWLDGHFECPWTPPEVHTYYCDGSFQFSRDEQATGWVRSLIDHDDFLRDRLQYVDQNTSGQYIYRLYSPGVLLKRAPPDGASSGSSVFVAQALYGQLAPHSFPPIPEDMDIGRCVTVTTADGPVMLSRMRVRPLVGTAAADLMPPPALAERIRRFLEYEARVGAAVDWDGDLSGDEEEEEEGMEDVAEPDEEEDDAER